MMYTLRYIKTAPIQPRPHAPTVPVFHQWVDADEWLQKQGNDDVLEVVKR